MTGVYVAMSNFFEPLNDVRVRKAIAMGIDRQRIVDNFFPPGSPLTPDFVPPAVFGHVGEERRARFRSGGGGRAIGRGSR